MDEDHLGTVAAQEEQPRQVTVQASLPCNSRFWRSAGFNNITDRKLLTRPPDLPKCERSASLPCFNPGKLLVLTRHATSVPRAVKAVTWRPLCGATLQSVQGKFSASHIYETTPKSCICYFRPFSTLTWPPGTFSPQPPANLLLMLLSSLPSCQHCDYTAPWFCWSLFNLSSQSQQPSQHED